ncbi:MAG: 30S ribosomal protein S4, partial [Candidatus Dojkabacteria bacterium]
KGKVKLCRRERYDLYPRIGDQSQINKRIAKRTAPGEHPMFPRQTLYATQFREKQKVKRMYGLLERQFRRFFAMADKQQGQTGTILLQLLEMRLDNAVYRAGMAKTRDQARQMVNHGHVLVNGIKVDVPSAIVKTGDKVNLKEKITGQEWYDEIKKLNESYSVPTWMNKVSESEVEVTNIPAREDADMSIREQLIVEFYSK